MIINLFTTKYKNLKQIENSNDTEIFWINDFENLNNILTNKEKRNLSIFIISILLIFNLAIYLMINQLHLKVAIFFINNLYLIYFTFNHYIDNKQINEENTSITDQKNEKNEYTNLEWDNLLNISSK